MPQICKNGDVNWLFWLDLKNKVELARTNRQFGDFGDFCGYFGLQNALRRNKNL